MAGDRTLTLKILGDTKDLVDSLGKATKSTDSFGKQIGDISAKVVKSFALIGGAIAGVSIAFAKAAAEDQQAANKLTQTIESVTNATNAQIKAVGNYITQASLATGISDDQLRPAFERLVRSTKDVAQAQDLLNLSLDLSAATGKPLEATTNALAKAYDGSFTSLQKLGLGLDAAAVKAKDFDAIQKQLNATYGEFSEKRSEEVLVKFQRLQVALQEAKETIGAALLPLFVKLGDWLLNEGVPRLNGFIAGLTGDKSLSAGFTEAQKQAEEFGAKVRSIIETLVDYKGVAIGTAGAVATVFAVSNIAAGVAATITAIKSLIAAYNALKASAIVAGVASAFALNPLLGVGAVALAAAVLAGANALANRSSGGEDGGVNLGLRPLGGGTAGGGGGGGISLNPDGTIDYSNVGGSTGGTTGTKTGSTGTYGSLTAMLDRLTAIDAEVKQVQFLIDSGQISKSDALALLDKLQKETNYIDSLAGTFASNNLTSSGTTVTGGVSRGEYIDSTTSTAPTNVTINVNSPSIIDETGFTRAVIDALNSVEYRSGGGASQLAYL